MSRFKCMYAERIKKMGSKRRKKGNTYVPEALKSFAKDLEMIRGVSKSANVPKSQVNIENIQKALEALPQEDRESVEKYWGLTGGPNHSKKIIFLKKNDRAMVDMRNRAIVALKKLSKLELARIYDASVDKMIDLINKKINKDGVSHISDFESTKYLLAFLIIFENGPEASIEDNQTITDNNAAKYYLDEYEALKQMCYGFEELPDKSIKLALIKSLFEMMDFKEWLVVRENFGIKSNEIFYPEEIEFLKSLNVDVSDITSQRDIPEIMTFGSMKTFKEKIFKNGRWDVACRIILDSNVNLEDFVNVAGKIYKNRNWIQKLEEFKTERTEMIKMADGIRNVNIYSIGGLEFTDPREIDFLRLHLA